jgi:hypothetical protein
MISGGHKNEKNILVGDKYSKAVDTVVKSVPLVTDPENNVIKAAISESGVVGVTNIYLESVELAGIYKLEFDSEGKTQREYFAVNLDTTTESELKSIKDEDAINKLDHQVRFASPDDIVGESVQSEEKKADLSSRFLIIAAMLMLLEIPLANRYKMKEQEED